MGEEFFLNVLGNNGLAVAGFLYVLFRINPTLQKLTDAINKLNLETQNGIKELSKEIDHRLDALEKENAELRHEVNMLKRP